MSINLLYGIEPELCISHPEILTLFSQDLILPNFFYLQLQHLASGNFGDATKAALQIINSWQREEVDNLLIFRNNQNSLVYVHNEEVGLDNFENGPNLDLQNPFDKYLISLLKLSEFWHCKIAFLALSHSVIRKCLLLGFEIVKLEEISDTNNRWLQLEMIINMQENLNPSGQINWQDDLEPNTSNDVIKWVDM